MYFFPASTSTPMDFASFLANEGPDYTGRRTLAQIWAYNHTQMEDLHDYIQVVFPTNEPSQFNARSSHLDSELIASLRANPVVIENMVKSANWFLDFLQESHHWHASYDHNQLRITRIIKSLRLLVSDETAHDFRGIVYEMLPDNHRVNPRTLQFWQDACPDLTPRPSSPN